LDPAEYDYMFQLEDSLWWYVGMRRIVHNLLQPYVKRNGGQPLRVLDAGCGTGGSLKQLEHYGQVTAFDFYPRAAELYATRQQGRILVASADAVPFADNSFDLVTSFDVVCQLPAPQDEVALEEMARVLKPGGSFVVRVPAFQALHGPHDVTLHTQHRYTTEEMSNKLERAGMKPVHTTYANTILFPVAVTRRMFAKLSRKPADESDVRGVPEPLNKALTAVLSAEAEILKRTKLPFGLSVIAVARKP
jgi:SAM-dependent methyltransferase